VLLRPDYDLFKVTRVKLYMVAETLVCIVALKVKGGLDMLLLPRMSE
jgi:hypothetical protein